MKNNEKKNVFLLNSKKEKNNKECIILFYESITL